MNRKIVVILIFIVGSCSYFIDAQDVDTIFFRAAEIKLNRIYNDINSASDNSSGIEPEIAFRDSLIYLLRHDGAFFYTFDSLKTIGRIASDDQKLVVFTWNIPQISGYSNYYCVILNYSKKDKKYFVYTLKESPEMFAGNQQMKADINFWPGALYYKIISTKFKGQIYYTLMGFNFNNILSNYKIIEVITFDEENNLKFPSGMFLKDNKSQNRIVFEYAERAQMVLDYDQEEKRIIFDHLSPVKPSLEGQYQFYGPDFSYDGLLFMEGKWVYQSDVRMGD